MPEPKTLTGAKAVAVEEKPEAPQIKPERTDLRTHKDYPGLKTAPRFTPGHKLGGRPKGLKNKTSSDIRDAIVKAFFHPKMGGVKGLVEWGRKEKNRRYFYQIVSRLVPVDVNVDVNEHVSFTIHGLIDNNGNKEAYDITPQGIKAQQKPDSDDSGGIPKPPHTQKNGLEGDSGGQ